MGDDVDELADSTLNAGPSTQEAPFLLTGRNRAACLDESPEFFFPIGNAQSALLQIEKTKACCRRCEVAGGCLKCAVGSGQDAVVWGGLSQDERHALQRRNARASRIS